VTFTAIQTPADLAQCAELEATVLASLAKRNAGPNYTKLEAERRYFIGYRCEFAVRDWLATMPWLESKYQINPNGQSQPSEFLVRFGGKWNRLEVKGRGKPEHPGAWIKQSQKHDWAVVVIPHLVGGVDDPRCVIRGWMGIKDLPQCKVVGGSYERSWAALRPLHRLPQLFLQLQTHDEWLASYGEVA